MTSKITTSYVAAQPAHEWHHWRDTFDGPLTKALLLEKVRLMGQDNVPDNAQVTVSYPYVVATWSQEV